MRVCGAAVVLTALASCAVDPSTAGDIDSPEPAATLRTPCPAPGAQCTDIYFVAHEDDDLLFMNPDISNSIEQGNHVVVVHLTAGDLNASELSHTPDQPSRQQYWMDRERGNVNAYTFMALGAAYTAYVPGNSISSYWSSVADSSSSSAITIDGVELAEYDLVQGSQAISLVYLRLSDLQLEDAWLNRRGRGGMAAQDPDTRLPQPLPAGSVQTVACSGCPLASDIPRQVLTRGQLMSVLQDLITRFTAGTPYNSVSFQDASGIYIDGLDTAHSCNPRGRDRGATCGYYDYWDHVYGAMFVLSAALIVQATQSSALSLREYQDYSTSQEPATLSGCAANNVWCDSETTAKTYVMAYYGLYDDGLVDHGSLGFSVTAPSFQKAASTREHQKYDPARNRPPTYDDYDASDPYGWESRQLELRSVVANGPLRARLRANGHCLGASGSTLIPVACADAPTWDLTVGGELQLTGTDQCATVNFSGAIPPLQAEPVSLGPCSPAWPAMMMVKFENGQIRTLAAKCLSMTSTVESVVCTNAHDTNPALNPHATGFPVEAQDWTMVFP